MGVPEDLWFTAMLSEHKAKHSEYLEYLRGMYVLSTAGGALVAALFYGGVQAWDKAYAVATLFNVALPFTLLVFGLLLFVAVREGAVIRAYLRKSELKLQALLGNGLKKHLEHEGVCSVDSYKVVEFETWLQNTWNKKGLSEGYFFPTFVAMFGILFTISVVLGEIRIHQVDIGWGNVLDASKTTRTLLTWIPVLPATLSAVLGNICYVSIFNIDHVDCPKVKKTNWIEKLKPALKSIWSS